MDLTTRISLLETLVRALEHRIEVLESRSVMAIAEPPRLSAEVYDSEIWDRFEIVG